MCGYQSCLFPRVQVEDLVSDHLPEGSVAAAMESLGIEVYQNGDELVAKCPAHEARTGKEDGNPSWSINEETGTHFCFSCHYKGNLITLVRDIKGEEEAGLLRTQFEEHKWISMEEDDFAVTEKPTREEIHTVNFRPESWLDGYTRPPVWALRARRITRLAATEYEVLWDEVTDSWILPLRDPATDRLLGYQKKGQKTRMFRNRPMSIAKSETFFGWGAVVRAKSKIVVLVESPLDAVLLSDMYAPAMAICGSYLSDTQVALLREQNFDKVLLWLDNDRAGIRETDRMKRVLMENGIHAEFIDAVTYPEVNSGKDVGDLSFRTVGKILDAAGV